MRSVNAVVFGRSVILVWVGLSTATTLALAAKPEVRLINQQIREVEREISNLNRSKQDAHRTISKIQAGGLDGDPSYAHFEGECAKSCLPSSGACSEAVLEKLGIALPEDLDSLDDVLDSESVCYKIYTVRPKLDISPLCASAVQHCGKVAKLLEVKRLRNEIQSLESEITSKNAEKAELIRQRSDVDGSCVECRSFFGGSSLGFGGSGIFGSLHGMNSMYFGNGFNAYMYGQMPQYAFGYGMGFPGMGFGFGGLGMGGYPFGGFGGMGLGLGFSGLGLGGFGNYGFGGMGLGLGIGGFGNYGLGGYGVGGFGNYGLGGYGGMGSAGFLNPSLFGGGFGLGTGLGGFQNFHALQNYPLYQNQFSNNLTIAQQEIYQAQMRYQMLQNAGLGGLGAGQFNPGLLGGLGAGNSAIGGVGAGAGFLRF